jgi:hypothetical protein
MPATRELSPFLTARGPASQAPGAVESAAEDGGVTTASLPITLAVQRADDLVHWFPVHHRPVDVPATW